MRSKKTNPARRYFKVSFPKPLAKEIGNFLKTGIGKNSNTPMKLNKKCAMAILMAPDVFEFKETAMKAVMVVPMLAPIINGAACFMPVIFLPTIGTTTDVVIVLDRMAAVVTSPHAKDFN